MTQRRRDERMRWACGRLCEAWYAACLSEELGHDAPMARMILETPLVLWRDSAGIARVMEDRCLHRNALLSEGVIIDGCLACPYHGWTYDNAGRCVHIPSEGPHTEHIPRHIGLETFHVMERDGLIWVWMGGPEAPPARDPFPMPRWREPGWTSYYMKTPFENNVTNCVENFMDVPHTVFVHRGWFRSQAQRPIRTVVERTSDSVLVSYDQPRDSIGFTGKLLNPRGLPMTHTDKFYMPNNTRVDYAFGEEHTAFIITSTCTPIGPMETMVYTLISLKLGPFNRVGRLLLPWYTRQVIAQDVEIMAIQGRSLKLHGAPKFSSTPADLLHVHIEALRQWAASGGEGEPPPPVTQEMTFWV